jgi:hypothetical protein
MYHSEKSSEKMRVKYFLTYCDTRGYDGISDSGQWLGHVNSDDPSDCIKCAIYPQKLVNKDSCSVQVL